MPANADGTYSPYPTYGNSASASGGGQSYVPGYNNLPQGITNAGQGGNNAYVGSVQPNSLVANQLQGLLASNSPYIQQAQQAGMNSAASRGLLNSSIASGASQAAAIQSAMPIAAQDASTNANLQNLNLQDLNQILATRMNNSASMADSSMAAGASRYGTDQNNAGALQRQREQLAYGGEQAGLNRDFQQYMSQLGYQQQLGASAFNFAGQSGLSNQQFRQQAGLSAMNNPFLLQDPSSLGGYMDWIGGGYSNNVDNLLNFSLGSGY